MIKIIKHGHEQYRMTCKYCECLFSFEDEDIKSNGNQRDYSEWIICPECGRSNNIWKREEFKFHSYE